MNSTVSITITHPQVNQGYVRGFLHLWAMYVRGFNPAQHCQKALRGRLSGLIKTRMTPLNVHLLLDEVHSFNSIYLCGVACGRVDARKLNNLHVPLERLTGEMFQFKTFNGYIITVENARRLPIPELPPGWNGLPDAFTRCCNFRFCVSRFGYTPQISECDTEFAA